MKDLGNKTVMAANIKRYMKEKGVNAKELSRALEVPYTTVLSWLKAEYYPRIDKIERMSEYFGILKSDLIENKEKPVAMTDDELSASKREMLDMIDSFTEEEAERMLQLLKLALGREGR